MKDLTKSTKHPLLHFTTPFTGGISLFKEDFEDIFGDITRLPKIFNSTPKANITQNDNEYKVSLAIPGVDKNNLNVAVDAGILTISSENKNETSEQNENYSMKEFSYSNFKRSFTLPDNANSDSITSKYINGVLEVVIPKTNEKKTAKTIVID